MEYDIAIENGFFAESRKPLEVFSQEAIFDDKVRSAEGKAEDYIENNTLYHGSCERYSVLNPQPQKDVGDKKALSLSPFIGIASLFTVPVSEIGKGKYKRRCIKLCNWFENTSVAELRKPIRTVTILHNMRDEPTVNEEFTGYIHYIHANDALKDSSANPKWKGKEEVLSYVSQLKPYKIETVHTRLIAKYDKSVAPYDAIPITSSAKEDFVTEIINSKLKDNTFYHGSMNRYLTIKASTLKELDKPTISVTPFKRLACLYAIPLRSIGIDNSGNEKYQNAFIDVKEWQGDDTLQDEKYKICQTVHVVHNIPFLDVIDHVYTGYIHYIAASEVLDDCSKNPIIGKGPNELLCYKKELRPYHIETVHIRLVAKYDKSFARSHNGDATPTLSIGKEIMDNEVVAEEGFLDKKMSASMESMDPDSYASFMEEGMQLLDEFHCGCKEFSDWVTKLELMQLHNTTTDTGLKQLSYSLAQENIMTDTVKDIFRRIGQFIGWFWSKLKQLWNFFFGKVQRSIRLFKANLEKIKAHNASGKFINLEAFKKAQAPNTLLPGITLLTILEDWDPDPFYSAFEQCYDKFRTNIVELHDWFARIMDPSSPVNVFLKAGYGSGANKATGNKGTDLISDYLACGHHCKGSFEQESYVDIDVIFGLSEMIEHVIESYKKNAKLIDSKGVSGYEASRIITNLEDRADLTQTEAADLASKVQKLAGCMSVATDRYQKCFAKILEQGIILQTAYMKFMQ